MNAQHNFSFVRLLKNLKLFYFVKLLFQSFCKTYIKDFYFCQKGSKISANIRNLSYIFGEEDIKKDIKTHLRVPMNSKILVDKGFL